MTFLVTMSTLLGKKFTEVYIWWNTFLFDDNNKFSVVAAGHHLA